MAPSQTELPQIELKTSPARGAAWLLGFWRRSAVSEEMWHIRGEPYQMCLIGRGVCRMATRDPPWLRKNTLYSSWKTCRHGPDPSVTTRITCTRVSGPHVVQNPLYQPASDLKEEVHARLLCLFPLLKRKWGVRCKILDFVALCDVTKSAKTLTDWSPRFVATPPPLQPSEVTQKVCVAFILPSTQRQWHKRVRRFWQKDIKN